MSTLLIICGALLIVIVSMTLAWRVLRPLYMLSTPADEIHHAHTEDGWALALYRYRPAHLVPSREPIILCHGMLTNRYNVDLDQGQSLARYLRREGFDVWIMELRGHGASRRRSFNGHRPYDWTIDDYIQRDLLAVVRTVTSLTGSERVHWFGHSLGGMILYAACADGRVGSRFRSAVVSDAPATFRSLRRRVTFGRLYGRLFPTVPPALVLPLLGPVVWLFPGIMKRRYGIGERRLIMSLLANAIIPWGSSAVLLHLCDILEKGRFVSMDGSIDYEEGASKIDFPLLVISSSRKMIKEEAVRDGIERAPAAKKRYVRFGRADGYTIDYTHSNLLLARSSPVEVFPEIATWFRDCSSA